ncbi:MAG: hypothetical protein JO141_04830 [Bradyrhizobium sp.]|nr:hypothetical protein [Bradyrhizobium sp.]
MLPGQGGNQGSSALGAGLSDCPSATGSRSKFSIERDLLESGPAFWKLRYRLNQRAVWACAVCAGVSDKQRRAASISESVAPWLRAHISAVEAEYFAT